MDLWDALLLRKSRSHKSQPAVRQSQIASLRSRENFIRRGSTGAEAVGSRESTF